MENCASGLYIHVPYCRGKCLYCDFYSGGSRTADWDLYKRAILTELNERRNELKGRISTLYIGGGTPSLIPDEVLGKLISGIKAVTGNDIGKDEFTLEVNPEDVTEDRCENWRKFGINRLSIGVQSLNDAELQLIGRRHNAEKALQSLSIAVNYFENISADVMFGLPNQTFESYKITLDKIVASGVSHISAYSLMLEEGTAMNLLVKQGKIGLPAEDEWLDMYKYTCWFLENKGYRRYEISNFAKVGEESIHNTRYWLGNPYLGLGPGAHSYDGGNIRRSNPPDLKGYLKRFGEEDNKSLKLRRDKCSKQFYDEEILNDNEMREEMVMTRLRTAKGLPYNEFGEKFGRNNLEILKEKSKDFMKRGYLEDSFGHLKFTKEGFTIFDSVVASLI